MPNYCRLVRLPRLVRAMPNARVPGALRVVLPLVLWPWGLPRCCRWPWVLGAGAVVLVLVPWCWCRGAGAVVLELWCLRCGAGAVVLVLVPWCCGASAGAVVLVLWCLRCGAGAVVLVLWCLRCGAGAVVLVLVPWCWSCGAGAVVPALWCWCWVLPAAWRAQFPCARIGCIPHEVQGHTRTRAGHAAHVSPAPTHKPRVV